MAEFYCPKCGRRFEEGASLCEDCQEPLVAQEAVSSDAPPPMVLLTRVPDSAEATILTNALRAEGIDATTEEMDLLEVNMLDADAERSGIPVMVNARDSEKALEVLRAHREGKLSLAEEEIPPTEE